MFGKEGWNWGGSRPGPEANKPPQADTKSYYDILGVDRTLEGEAFTKALRAAMAKATTDHHPDKYTSSGNKQYHEDLMRAASEAYAVLKNEKRRNGYDAALGSGEVKARDAAYRALNYKDGDVLLEQEDREQASAAREKWRREKKMNSRKGASGQAPGGETSSGSTTDQGTAAEQEARGRRAEAWQAEQKRNREERDRQQREREDAARRAREQAEKLRRDAEAGQAERQRQERQKQEEARQAREAEQTKVREEAEKRAREQAERLRQEREGQSRIERGSFAEKVENRAGFEVKIREGKVFFVDSKRGVESKEGFEDVQSLGKWVFGVRDGKKHFIDTYSGASTEGYDDIVIENGRPIFVNHSKYGEKAKR